MYKEHKEKGVRCIRKVDKFLHKKKKKRIIKIEAITFLI